LHGAEIVDLVADPGQLALEARHVVRPNLERCSGQHVAQRQRAGGNPGQLLA